MEDGKTEIISAWGKGRNRMEHEHINLIIGTIGAIAVLFWICIWIGKLIANSKIKTYKKEMDIMTKEKFLELCAENQMNCPHTNNIDKKLQKILELSEENSKNTKHIAECFILYLSQTDVDNGVKNYIEDKLKQQVKKVMEL